VTGEHRGKGLVSLFHVSADMRWSDLPMSGSFVEMLRRIVDASGYTSNPGAGVAGEAKVETVAPLRTLDGFRGVRTTALNREAVAGRLPGPGGTGPSARFLWPGRRSSRGSMRWRRRIALRRSIPLACARGRASYTNAEPRDLRGILLSSSLALFLIDAIIVAVLGAGIAALLRRRAAPAALGVGAGIVHHVGSAIAVPCRQRR